jgi:hypothetical protein
MERLLNRARGADLGSWNALTPRGPYPEAKDNDSVGLGVGAQEARLLKWIVVVVVMAVLTYFALLFFLHGGNRDFLRIDSCLDAGGRWKLRVADV